MVRVMNTGNASNDGECTDMEVGQVSLPEKMIAEQRLESEK